MQEWIMNDSLDNFFVTCFYSQLPNKKIRLLISGLLVLIMSSIPN